MAERKMPQNLEAEMMALGCAFLTRYACDKVCEDLQSYKVNISKLPFNIDSNRQTRVQMKESKESIFPTSRFDDDVDAQLLAFAGKSIM